MARKAVQITVRARRQRVENRHLDATGLSIAARLDPVVVDLDQGAATPRCPIGSGGPPSGGGRQEAAFSSPGSVSRQKSTARIFMARYFPENRTGREQARDFFEKIRPSESSARFRQEKAVLEARARLFFEQTRPVRSKRSISWKESSLNVFRASLAGYRTRCEPMLIASADSAAQMARSRQLCPPLSFDGRLSLPLF